MRRVAEQSWPAGELPGAGFIMLTITYFYEGESAIGIDNIPKPILDALKGLIYLDDAQVTDILCRKSLNSDLRIENPSSVLAEGPSRGNEFLHILVEEAPDQEVIA